MSKIKKVVVHCSDSPDDRDIGVKEIRRWHTDPPPKGRGWTSVGYHAIVRRSGVIEAGRFENGDSILEGKEIGAHVKGHNSDSLAICWVGREAITPPQRRALVEWIVHWLRQHKLKPSDVYGHYEFNPHKTCPNLDMERLRAEIAAAAGSVA